MKSFHRLFYRQSTPKIKQQPTMTSNYMKRFSSTYFKNNANFDKNEIIMAKIFENEDDNKKKNSTRTSLGYYYQTNNYSHNYGT